MKWFGFVLIAFGILGCRDVFEKDISPSFERAELYLLDTLVAGYNYTCTLEPGDYAWGVRPENSAYEGIFTRRVFTVLEDSDDETPEEP